MKLYRQGDILFKKLDENPDIFNLKQIGVNLITVGYGEVTGHKHQIKEKAKVYSSNNRNVEVFALTGIMEEPIFIEIEETTNLVHEEHNPIELSPGWYEPIRQREYEPERIRYVSD